MILNGQHIAFPAVIQISFFKVIEDLEAKAKGKSAEAKYAKTVLQDIEKYPELRDGFESSDLLRTYEKPIGLLSKHLFPEPLLTNEIKALTPPFYVEPFFTSTRFENIISASEQEFMFKIRDIDADTYYLYGCYFILKSHYGYSVPGGGTMMVEIENKAKGLTKTYRMAVNADLTEFLPTEKAVDITEKDFHELLDNFGDMELWKSKFPPNSWILKGINVINLMDVTVDQSLSAIRSNLVFKSPDSFDNIKAGLRQLFQIPELDVGIVGLEEDNFISFHGTKVTSILLQKSESISCENNLCGQSYDQLIGKNKTLVFSDVADFYEKSQSGISKILNDKQIGSYILAPLEHEEEMLGYMELSAPNAYQLNTVSLSLLNEILPIIAMATKRFKREEHNLIEAIIQQECTSIHSSVNWRFEEEARRYIHDQRNNGYPVFKDIIFRDVYPLYGQLDIKGSSEKRNEAVKSDLIKQINMIRKILIQAFELTNMPIYEELITRVNTFKDELVGSLSVGSEHKTLSFIMSVIEPVFKHLTDQNSDLAVLVENYEKRLDKKLRSIYKERKKYDDSVDMINQSLASYLDDEQENAQKMFPHFFERYKTDGLEFNIYIGESIAKDRSFDPIYLHNLRLWQLLVMCEMENRFHSLKNNLAMPLEIASLILVHSTPLSIHFRTDEKQFDVDGAYNARYEIVKKRVDKAHIKGSKERITKPGHLAIIYLQEQEAIEYKRYIGFLQSRGYVEPGIEDVELEHLQGISGLRALRVALSYQGISREKKRITVDEIIQAIDNS